MHAEFKAAQKEGRQPCCPYCHKPLEIGQTQRITLFWRWNPEKKAYENKVSEGDAYQPFCTFCLARDWDFLDAPMDGQTARPIQPKSPDESGPVDDESSAGDADD